MTNSSKLMSSFVLLLFCLAPCAVTAEASSEEMLADLTAAVRDREERFDNYRFRGSASSDVGGRRLDVTYDVAGSGDKLLFSLDGSMSTTRGADDITVTMATDGRTARTFQKMGAAGFGVIQTPDALKQSLVEYWVLPTRLGITALPEVSAPLSSLLELAGKNEPSQMDYFGAPAAVTVALHPSTDSDRPTRAVLDVDFESDASPTKRYRAHFAPELGLACVKIELGNVENGSFAPESEILMASFEEGPPGIFVPQEVSIAIFEGHDAGKSTIKVDDFQYGGPLDDSLFAVEFPKGTRVDDQLLGTSYVGGAAAVPDADSLVEEPAPLQETTNVPLIEGTNVPPDAAPAPLQEGTNVPPEPLQEDTTEPPQEGTNVPAPPSRLPLILLALAALCIVFFLLIRRKPGK